MNDASRARLATRALVVGALAATLAVYATHATMESTTFALPGERDMQILAWAPQTFRFFTRDPQEERVTAFVQEGGAFRSLGKSGADPSLLFGLDRSSRGLGIEMGLVMEDVPKALMRPCEDEPAACLARLDRAMKVENPTPNARLCGQVGIVLQKPVPWVWARHGKPITMPSRVIRLEVSC